MKTIGIVVVAIFALFGVIAAVLFALTAYESETSRFATHDELWASGLVERGWIPVHIPRTAKSIVESHDVSSSSGGATFEYDPVDTVLTRENCKLLAESDRGSKFLCPPFDEPSFIVVLRRDGTGTWTVLSDAI